MERKRGFCGWVEGCVTLVQRQNARVIRILWPESNLISPVLEAACKADLDRVSFRLGMLMWKWKEHPVAWPGFAFASTGESLGFVLR